MAVPRRITLYRVKVSRCEAAPNKWEWEILRNDKPLAARMREGAFDSDRAARAAGTAVLCEFLELLKREQDAK
jgi:hypothetical protein